MIKYDLVCCGCRHVFETWFRSSEDYDLQEKKGLLECPACSSQSVKKTIMAPNIHTSEKQAAARKELAELKKYVKTNFEDVGDRFTEEAVSMWRGETEVRDIHGIVGPEDKTQLEEEGVPYIPLPGGREDA